MTASNSMLIGLILLILSILTTVSDGYIPQDHVGTVDQIIRERLTQLKRLALLNKHHRKSSTCSTTRFVRITEIPFGNSGNNLIEFTHGLWVAQQQNATLLVPHWIAHILKPFDTDLIRTLFCFVLEDEYKQILASTHTHAGTDPIINFDVTSEDSFFLFRIFYIADYKHFNLPPHDASLIHKMSAHYLSVYAALWSSPLPHLVTSAVWIIENKLESCFRYTTAHKRSLEGGCSKLMAASLQMNQFNPYQVPMNHTLWQANLALNHPLCDMKADFVLATQALNHRNGSKIFLAFDGRGDISDYEAVGAVLATHLNAESWAVQHKLKHHTAAGASVAAPEPKFLDMFIAMQGDFFVLNPVSTFSWEIFLIRVCLGLESVPVVESGDIYFMTQMWYDYYKRPANATWVSYTSVLDAIENLVD